MDERTGMIQFGSWVADLGLDDDVKIYGRERKKTVETNKSSQKKSGTHSSGRSFKNDQFIRNYGILIVAAALFTLYTILLSAWVGYKTEKRVREEMEQVYEQRIAEYHAQKRAEESAQYFLSGEASKEAAMNQDAIALAQDGGVWKNEEAFKGHCWNVVMRSMNPGYPNTIKGCLEQKGQYDYHDPNGTYTEEKFQWALEVLKQADTGMLPAYLTINHVFVEMKDGGATCILHTTYDKKGNDDPWRYKG